LNMTGNCHNAIAMIRSVRSRLQSDRQSSGQRLLAGIGLAVSAERNNMFYKKPFALFGATVRN
jgi:hypothetical protein